MLIGIDPGHGGADEGATTDYWCERDINWSIALWAKTALRALKYQVMLSRVCCVEQMALPVRGRILEDCNFVISIHCDSNPNQELSGTCCYYYPTSDSKQLALRQALSREILNHVPPSLRPGKMFRVEKHGWRRRAYNVVTAFQPMAILVECGFLTNASDRQLLSTLHGQQSIGLAIGQAIHAWLQDIQTWQS